MPNASTALPHVPAAGTLRRLVPAAALALLAGCSSVSNYVPGFIQPYRPDVQQGNWLTSTQVELLRPGMTRDQVRFALGSPTLTSVFRADRWDYPYLFIPGHGKPEERKFTVFFEGDRLARWTGDEQPDRQPFQQANTRKQPLSTSGPAAAPPQNPAPLNGAPPPRAMDPSTPPVATPPVPNPRLIEPRPANPPPASSTPPAPDVPTPQQN